MNNTFKFGITLLLSLYSSFGFPSSSLKQEAFSEMKSIRSEFSLPSLSLAILLNDELAFSDAVGFADASKLIPASPQTQYSVGSLAKPMTGLALAKLVDMGRVKLEDPVSNYVSKPSYTASFTVEELAAHIAGIRHDTPERDTAEFQQTRDHVSPLEAFYVFDKHPLVFEPGSDYHYSSNGYILLSAVIEQGATQSYVEFLNTALWQPLQMQSTELDTSTAGKKHEATYYSEYQNETSYSESTKHRDRSFLFGGGGFISTPTDLVKLARATFQKNSLSQNMQSKLLTPVKLRNGEVNSDNYSIGWRVGEVELNHLDDASVLVLHHGGVTDKASNAYLFVVPQCKAAIAFAANNVPDKFWKIRGRVARLLINHIQEAHCNIDS